MKNLFKTSLFCLSTLLATPALATTSTNLTTSPPSIEETAPNSLYAPLGPFDYSLAVDESIIMPNISRWKAYVECTIESESDINVIHFKALYKKGTVNDISLVRGDTMTISVDTGETVYLSAEAGARVELTNEGTADISARCYVSF